LRPARRVVRRGYGGRRAGVARALGTDLARADARASRRGTGVASPAAGAEPESRADAAGAWRGARSSGPGADAGGRFWGPSLERRLVDRGALLPGPTYEVCPPAHR